MHLNEGFLDRAIRFALGLGLLSLTLVGPQTLWGLVGVAPLATAMVGYCPLYQAIGLTTRHTAKG